VTLRKGPWTDHGWPAGTPTLAVAGATLRGTSDATAKVAPSKRLVKATVTVDGKSPYAFWIELRDGHRYTVSPDPCCFLVVADLDDLADKTASPPRCATKGVCPAGLVAVDKFASHGLDCGNDGQVCAAPALLRVRGDRTTIAWAGEGEAPADGAYHAAPVGREHPHRLVVRRDGKIVWDAAIVVHHGRRYTLDAAARDVAITLD
jgi:hypothetical protein